MDPRLNSKEFYTLKEVVERLRISLSTASRRLKESKEAPWNYAVKIGRRVLIPVEAIQASKLPEYKPKLKIIGGTE